MQAYVVPEISSISNSHIESARDQFPHLKGLWFSDIIKKEERLEKSILIGADYLWKFQKGCVIRGKVEEPVALETKLGWVLSGPMKCEFAKFEDGVSTVQANLIVQDQYVRE